MKRAKPQAGISQEWRNFSTGEGRQRKPAIWRNTHPPSTNTPETSCSAGSQTEGTADF